MPRRALTFTQADVARAAKGVKQAGFEVERVEVGKDGKIIVYTPGAAKQSEPEVAFDAWKAKSHARPS